ncbi:MAG: hypothetical protein Q7N50_12920 [Armatimonadota bacterium]|nr:hypothetical protein [Armatimonadota bacterium]
MGIAEAAIIESDGGIPAELLQRGLAALRKRANETEAPVVVVVCGSLETGMDVRIPGFRITGLAAQSAEYNVEECRVPAVTGVGDLLPSVSNGDIVIVDGTWGVVYIDPDAETLMHYQNIEDKRKERRVFLESTHLPAVTQTGHTVLVFATVSDPSDAESALAEGADGLLLTSQAIDVFTTNDWIRLLEDTGGKPLLLAGAPEPFALRTIITMALPGQITIAMPPDEQFRLSDLQSLIEDISGAVSEDNIEPAEINFAAISDVVGRREDETLPDISRFLVNAAICDVSPTQADLSECISEAVSVLESSSEATPKTVWLATSVDSVRYLMDDGVDSVAVPLGFVSTTKDLIRSFPAEE